MKNVKVLTITKVAEGKIDVPLLPKEYRIKEGFYKMIFNKVPIKIGIFGEGVAAGSHDRFKGYRTTGKRLNTIRYQNGSYKSMKVLDSKLKVGDSVDVYFYSVPERVVLENGYTYKVDLYDIESKLKTKYKNTLWLT